MSSHKKDIYKITVKNWEKYNGTKKKGHRSILLSTSFLDDSKVSILSEGGKLLYLKLLLCCGEHTSNSIECTHELLVRSCGGRGYHVTKLLDHIQQLQLVTYEKIPFFNNRIEKNRKEENRIPKEKRIQKDAPQPPKEAVPVSENSHQIVALYCDNWKDRYKSEKSPVVMPHHAKLIKTLVKQIGLDRSKDIVSAYFKMPDTWFVTKRHDIPTLMGNLNAITQYLETGKMITRKDLKNMESKLGTQSLLQMVDEGKL